MDFIDDVKYLGLWLLLLFVRGRLLLFLLVFVYALRFYVVHLSCGFLLACVERGNLVVYIMKDRLGRDRKISGLAIHE